jgi:DNA-binding protein H-NS
MVRAQSEEWADNGATSTKLLNEFLKEHRKVEEQQRTIVELKTALAQQQKNEIKVLTAGLERVSNQLELRTCSASRRKGLARQPTSSQPRFRTISRHVFSREGFCLAPKSQT